MVDRTLRRIFILSGIALILWVLYLLKPVVLPFIAAFLVAYLFSPLVDKLHRIGLPRWLSIGIVFIGIGIIVGEGAVVGNSTELKNVILFNKVQVPHYNCVGDSILGYKSHIGAGVKLSNYKSDGSIIILKELNIRFKMKKSVSFL